MENETEEHDHPNGKDDMDDSHEQATAYDQGQPGNAYPYQRHPNDFFGKAQWEVVLGGIVLNVVVVDELCDAVDNTQKSCGE